MKKHGTVRIIIKFVLCIGILVTYITLLCFCFSISDPSPERILEFPYSIAATIIASLVAIICIFAGAFFAALRTGDDAADQKDSEYRKYLESRINNASDDEPVESETEEPSGKIMKLLHSAKNAEVERDVFALMLKNLDETTDYLSLIKKQAHMAYMVSIWTCAAGIVFLMTAVIILIVLQRGDLAVIPMISGAVTEVISGTVLWVFNKASMQLNHYYAALHENEKLLSAIKLVVQISEDRRDEMYIEIIRSLLPSATVKEGQIAQRTETKGESER